MNAIYVREVDGVLRGKFMVSKVYSRALECTNLQTLQSTEKFLSAAKSDGFGFCSVILQVSYLCHAENSK